MAIHQEDNRQMNKSMLKTIDSGGLQMMFDMAQRYQYQYPIKSTVRELLSNGIDSVAERKTAHRIIKGGEKVEDFFVELEGEVYKDSKFDPAYYDFKHLSSKDKVTLAYHVGSNMEKDRVEIIDYGVGMSAKRLEGYFKLAFSTKRLSKIPLGKFGLGAKSPLSIGMDFYTVESRYNGRLYRFNIYSHDIQSIIPKFNLRTGEKYQSDIFYAGTDNEYEVFWMPTTEPNGVTVTIEAKKHHRQQYIDAVKSQMLYFDNVVCEIHENGHVSTVEHRANVIYEDDMIVMSDNHYFSKPHLLLNKVNYGYIDWSELELQQLHGNIGIKVQPEDVDVNPSRETVMWTEKTKDTVLQRFKEVVGIATNLIQEKLKETDFLRWLRVCYTISSQYYADESTVVGRLSKIVDLSDIKPTFTPNPVLKFHSSDPLPDIYMRHITKLNTRKGTVKLDRAPITGLATAIGSKFILLTKGEKVSNRKDKYLLHLYGGALVHVHEPYETTEEYSKAYKSGEITEGMHEVYHTRKLLKGGSKQALAAWNELLKSPEVLVYGKVTVPDDFTGTEDELVEEDMSEEAIAAEVADQYTAEERRKLEGKTVVMTPRLTGSSNGPNYSYPVFEWRKLEVPISSINNWRAPEVYYGHDGEVELFRLITLLTMDPSSELHNPHRKIKVEDWYKAIYGSYTWGDPHYRDHEDYSCQHYFDTEVMLVKVAQSNAKYYRDFKRLQEFFISIKDNTITMSNALIKWNTARVLHNKIRKLDFFTNYAAFHPVYAEAYKEIYKYYQSNYRPVDEQVARVTGLGATTYTELIAHLDNVHRFQDFVASKTASPEDIATLAQSLFGNRELTDGMAVDNNLLDTFNELLEYAQGVGPMLNQLPVLTNKYEANRLNEELELEIRMFLEYKGMLNYVSENSVERAVDEIESSPAVLVEYDELVDKIETVLVEDLTNF